VESISSALKTIDEHQTVAVNPFWFWKQQCIILQVIEKDMFWEINHQ
jgi:hypothetical protein